MSFHANLKLPLIPSCNYVNVAQILRDYFRNFNYSYLKSFEQQQCFIEKVILTPKIEGPFLFQNHLDVNFYLFVKKALVTLPFATWEAKGFILVKFWLQLIQSERVGLAMDLQSSGKDDKTRAVGAASMKAWGQSYSDRSVDSMFDKMNSLMPVMDRRLFDEILRIKGK